MWGLDSRGALNAESLRRIHGMTVEEIPSRRCTMKTLKLHLVLPILGMALGLVLAEVPATAHHAFSAEFDADKPVSLHGALTKMEWSNPHGWIYMDVKGADGATVNWAIEFGTPNELVR